MIHLVVALKAEATPLVDCLGLRGDRERRPFRVYGGAEIRLVVSGVGKKKAAAAATYLHERSSEPADAWLNVGVGAHRELPIGQLVAAREIVEAATGRIWQLPRHVRLESPEVTVCTVDRPRKLLDDDRVYEMEAAGFAATVSRWVSAQRVACLKVVSDRGVDSPQALSRDDVDSLIRQNLKPVSRVLSILDPGTALHLSADEA